MTRQEFERRFREVLREAAAIAAEQIGHPVPVPDRFLVEGPPELYKRVLTLPEVIDALYLGPDRSRVVIDVAVEIGGEHAGAAWVRPSGHRPRPLSETWDADGLGPFKPIGGLGKTHEWDAAKEHGIPQSGA